MYVAFALVPLAWFVLNKTTLGLKIRAVGQIRKPPTMGISVARVRYFTVVFGGVMAAMAGASLSIALLNVFQQNIGRGQGFIAVALNLFRKLAPVWRNGRGAAVQHSQRPMLWVRTRIDIPAEYASMAPYLLTILALVFASQRVDQPAALKPFERGE